MWDFSAETFGSAVIASHWRSKNIYIYTSFVSFRNAEVLDAQRKVIENKNEQFE